MGVTLALAGLLAPAALALASASRAAAAEVARRASDIITSLAVTNISDLNDGTLGALAAGDLLMLVNRPQEVVASLQQLDNAYKAYFQAVQDYNRSQFRLFRAMGYPAEVLACRNLLDTPAEVDTTRPFDLPPVTAIPCANALCGPRPGR